MCVHACTVGSVLWLCWVCVLQGVREGFERWSTRCFMGRYVVDVGRSRAGDRGYATLCVVEIMLSGVYALRGCCGGPGGIAVGVCHLERHSPPSSTRMKSSATVVINLQNILKGVQAECTVFWENLAEQDFRELDIFRRNFYEPLLGRSLQAYKPWACSASRWKKACSQQ